MSYHYSIEWAKAKGLFTRCQLTCQLAKPVTRDHAVTCILWPHQSSNWPFLSAWHVSKFNFFSLALDCLSAVGGLSTSRGSVASSGQGHQWPVNCQDSKEDNIQPVARNTNTLLAVKGGQVMNFWCFCWQLTYPLCWSKQVQPGLPQSCFRAVGNCSFNIGNLKKR